MTMDTGADSRAKTRLQAIALRIPRLRATGPNPFDYWIWADETRSVLDHIFGVESAESRGFADIAHARGRTIDSRGHLDNMTLGLHGEWGIWARLRRAEPYLTTLVQRL